jgi:dTMP kinase
MRIAKFYGAGYPYSPPVEITGKLIVLEGTDGVGRTTQIDLLRQWLEVEGFAVSDTGLRRSNLTKAGLSEAKQGHTLSPLTMSLFYATDFADRLERQIIPALKAGFIVLSDRYFYSVIARDIVRGADPTWARKVYGFALIPDIVLYLKADVTSVVSRIVHGRGFDYWESGMDMHFADNLYDSFLSYQKLLSEQFDIMSKEFDFINLDANRPATAVFEELQLHISNLFSTS